MMEGMGVHEQSSGVPKAKQGKGQASQGENVKMHYIQHENGDIINGWRGQTYAATLGWSLLDLHWKVNCSLAGSKEWMQQPIPIITARW